MLAAKRRRVSACFHLEPNYARSNALGLELLGKIFVHVWISSRNPLHEEPRRPRVVIYRVRDMRAAARNGRFRSSGKHTRGTSV